MNDSRVQRQKVKAVHITDPIEKIATCARICYKSEPKGPEANLKLVNRLYKSGHTSTYEHVYVLIEPPTKDMMDAYVKEYCQDESNPNRYDGLIIFNSICGMLPQVSEFFFRNPDPRRNGLVGDLRAFADLFDWCRKLKETQQMLHPWTLALMSALHDYCPIDAFAPMDGISEEALKKAKIDGKLLRISDYSGYQTVIIDTARMMTHELVRHRVEFSYSQESTRYCRYKDGLHITVSEPNFAAIEWMEDPGKDGSAISEKNAIVAQCYKEALDKAQELYLKMIEAEVQPQIARGVLPLCTSATIAVTATTKAWRHWLKLRDASDADPMMQELAMLVRVQLPLDYWDKQDREILDFYAEQKKRLEQKGIKGPSGNEPKTDPGDLEAPAPETETRP